MLMLVSMLIKSFSVLSRYSWYSVSSRINPCLPLFIGLRVLIGPFLSFLALISSVVTEHNLLPQKKSKEANR